MKTLQLEEELKDFTALTNLKIDIINHGGATYNAYALTKTDFKGGYMVSLEHYEKVFTLDALIMQDIKDYSSIAGDRLAFIGAWYNKETETITLDVSIYIECLRDALTVGYANKQEAIYDILNDEVIYL